MITIEHTATLPYATGTVFSALADLSGYPAWQRDVLDVTPSDQAPVSAGTRVVQTRKVMGRRTEIGLTVSAYEPGTRLDLQTDPDARPAVSQSYTVHPDGATATRVEFRLNLDGVPKLAEHLVRAQLGRQVPDMFERLETVLAAN